MSGAIDGKHIRLIQPTHTGSLHYCFTRCVFTYKDVGAYAKSSDSAIFKDRVLYSDLVSNFINLPYVIVGDEDFGLHDNVMRPYGGHHLSYQQKIFNCRISRARRYIECTFGILSNKWRIFHRPITLNIDLAKNIVETCCILHNFVRSRDGYAYDNTVMVTGFESIMLRGRDRGGRTALAIRDTFADYFIIKKFESDE
nr:unnamed protein product [Callosobruchus chinensis]